MDRITAEAIARKTKALKHCMKLIEEINKKGSTIIKLGCTGVEFVVKQGDAMYFKLATTRAQLMEDVKSYEIVQKATNPKVLSTGKA